VVAGRGVAGAVSLSLVRIKSPPRSLSRPEP
jgi:hypothetical protein